jgi:hypothetical protein
MLGDAFAHLPLNDGASQVPSDVAGAGKEVIVPMQAAICFQHRAVRSTQPRVRHHPRIADGLLSTSQKAQIYAAVIAEFFLQVHPRHGLEIDRPARAFIAAELSGAKGTVLSNAFDHLLVQIAGTHTFPFDPGIPREAILSRQHWRAESSLGKGQRAVEGSFAVLSQSFESQQCRTLGGEKFLALHVGPRRGPFVLACKELLAPASAGKLDVLFELRQETAGCERPEEWPLCPARLRAEGGNIGNSAAKERDLPRVHSFDLQSSSYREE